MGGCECGGWEGVEDVSVGGCESVEGGEVWRCVWRCEYGRV